VSWLAIIAIAAGAYLAIGCLVAIVLIQTPYADNGFVVIMALWPLFVVGMLGVLH